MGVTGAQHLQQSVSLPPVRVQHSFMLQYTALMLIVLACVVGASFRHVQLPQHVEVTLPKIEGSELLSTTTYASMFEVGTSSVHPEVVAALADLLTQHDVSARIRVFGDLHVVKNQHLAATLALGRSIALQIGLRQKGVPAQSLQIIAEDSPNEAQAEVQLVKQEHW